MRPRCPRVQLEETYYLSPLNSQALEDAECSEGTADSAEEEEAAALLLGMGHLGAPAMAHTAISAVPGSLLKGCQDRQPTGSGPFRCTSCRQPVVLRGEKRPTFFCASCPSKGGAQKRAQRALHGSGDRVVSVAEAIELLQATGLQPHTNAGHGSPQVCI